MPGNHCRLVGRDSQKKPFGFGRKSPAPAGGNDNSGFGLPPDRYSRYDNGSIPNGIPECARHGAKLESWRKGPADTLRFGQNVLTLLAGGDFYRSASVRIPQPDINELQGKHFMKDISQAACDSTRVVFGPESR